MAIAISIMESAMRARPPSITWAPEIVLVAASLCSAAHAADIPLSIESAVHLSWQTTTNKAYEVQVSTNVAGPYIGTGHLIDGRGSRVGEFFESTSPQQFFRVQDTNSSGIAWLDGVWEGETIQADWAAFTTRISIGNSTGNFSGYYTNANFNCTTTLTLSQSSDTQARFFEVAPCCACADTIVTLTRVDATNITYLAYYVLDPKKFVVYGTLTKR